MIKLINRFAVVVLSFGSLVAAQEEGKININSASVEKLTELKGIGAAYAAQRQTIAVFGSRMFDPFWL